MHAIFLLDRINEPFNCAERISFATAVRFLSQGLRAFGGQALCLMRLMPRRRERGPAARPIGAPFQPDHGPCWCPVDFQAQQPHFATTAPRARWMGPPLNLRLNFAGAVLPNTGRDAWARRKRGSPSGLRSAGSRGIPSGRYRAKDPIPVFLASVGISPFLIVRYEMQRRVDRPVRRCAGRAGFDATRASAAVVGC